MLISEEDTMSSENVQRVVGQAITDVLFRKDLLSDPKNVLKDYDLTENERKGIMRLKEETYRSASLALGSQPEVYALIPSLSVDVLQNIVNQLEDLDPTVFSGKMLDIIKSAVKALQKLIRRQS